MDKSKAIVQLDGIISFHKEMLSHPHNSRPSAQRTIKRDLAAAEKMKKKLAKK